MEWVGTVFMLCLLTWAVVGTVLVFIDWVLENFFDTSVNAWIDKLFEEED